MTTPYMIGSYSFISLNGTPETVRRGAIPVQRAGVPGTGFITTGIKGHRPFQLQSVVDVTSLSNAQTLIYNYEQLQNDGLHTIIHAGTDYSATPVFNQYWVLDVIADWRRVSAAVGGLAGGQYRVDATWILLPVFVEPPEEEEDP